MTPQPLDGPAIASSQPSDGVELVRCQPSDGRGVITRPSVGES
jgi:hypothetical protein